VECKAVSSKKIWLEITTPVKLELRREVDYVVAPTINGVEGILPGHIRLITKLTTGVLRYRADGAEHVLAVSEGFMEVTPTKVILLAEVAELPDEIDVTEALAEKRKAEEILYHSQQGKSDFAKAQIHLQRAIARLQIAEKYGKNHLE
jgi:F-type H+-transporting ATPase subunit epsilon